MINVDRIVTISLKENHTRRTLAQTELSKLNLKTDFFLAERDSGHEERGCFNSHRQVCKQALDDGCQTLLIFEDDIKVLPYQQKQIDRVNRFLRENKKPFDILYLGLIIGKMWFCGMKSIVRAKGAGLHAYIISKQGMEKIITYQYQGIPIDKVIKRDFKCYSIYPIIAEQHPEGMLISDISASRKNHKPTDAEFWRENYLKQKWILWKNLHKMLFGD